MAVGGYAIIDFKGNDIWTSPVTIPGIHDRIERNIGLKPILLKNFKINGVERIPVYVSPFISTEGVFQLTYEQRAGQSFTLTVTANDQVSVRNFGAN